MYWLAAGDFQRTASLRWMRTVVSGDDTRADDAVETWTLPDAVWVQRGGRHYIRFHDPSQDPRADADQLVLRLDPADIALVRYGAAAWNQRFCSGETTRSVLRVAGAEWPVEIHTHELTVQVTPDGGRVDVVYHMRLGGVVEAVRLQLEFRREAEGDETGSAT